MKTERETLEDFAELLDWRLWLSDAVFILGDKTLDEIYDLVCELDESDN